jgi:hypothetical protein
VAVQQGFPKVEKLSKKRMTIIMESKKPYLIMVPMTIMGTNGREREREHHSMQINTTTWIISSQLGPTKIVW